MGWPHRRLSDLTSQELHQRAVEYRRMALAARGKPTASALDRLAIRYALLAAKREIEEASRSEGCAQEQPELAKLIASVKQAATAAPNPVKALAQFVRAVAEGDADPYLVAGLLLEAGIHTISTRVPPDRQEDTAGAFLQLAVDRLRANGMLNGT